MGQIQFVIANLGRPRGAGPYQRIEKPIINDELWTRIESVLPQPKARRVNYPGRKPLSNRAALNGIVFVLLTGVRWRDLPPEMDCGSGVTCWRRLRDWQEAGVWDQLRELLLVELDTSRQSTSCA